MNDDELRASLARRASAPLSADDRNDILRAARTEAINPAARGRPNLFPRVAGYLVGAVALLVLVLIALPILLSPPSVAAPSPNSSAASQQTQRVVQVPPSPGEESPSPTASSGPHVYSEQELANLIGDPNWVGKTVLADLPNGAIGHDPCASPLGTPVISCNLGSLNVHGPHSTVVVGLRDAMAGDGRQDDEGNGYTWVKQLEWPIEAGTYAFQVNSSDLDYLGPAHLASDGTPTSVTDAAETASQASDDVYVVNGWLGHTLLAPCAFPQQGLESPMPDISSYYCGGSWLADQQWDPPTSGLSIDGGMHVQNDAYDTYAPNPDQGGGGGASRFGTYLVRDAGCPEVVTGYCPVWRMVGRLDSAQASQPTSPAPTEGGFSTADLGDVTFDYPNSWRLNPVNEVDHYASTLAFATSESASTHSSCPDYAPEQGGGRCTHTYDVPNGSMLFRVDRYSLPSHGIETVACDQGAGGTPAEVGGMAGVTIDPFIESDLPAEGHAQAWRVAAPRDSTSNYTIYVVDNGYPNQDSIIDRLLSTFRINSPYVEPGMVDEATARNVALNYYVCAHEGAQFGDGTDNPALTLTTDPDTGRSAWLVTVSGTVTTPDASPFQSTMNLFVDATTGAVKLGNSN